jgi:RNA polymerase II transcription factor SIII (Elongin) subunit A
MPVRSLSELALRSILLHLDGLNSLGTIPYRLAKPILMQCQPEQLMEIERNSPASLLFYLTVASANHLIIVF